MKTRTLYALTCINLVLLALGLAQQFGPAHVQSAAAVLRGEALEIVDRPGTNNSYLILEAKGTNSSLTLRNENGRERVLSP